VPGRAKNGLEPDRAARVSEQRLGKGEHPMGSWPVRILGDRGGVGPESIVAASDKSQRPDARVSSPTVSVDARLRATVSGAGYAVGNM
jgi:hypothetical protein